MHNVSGSSEEAKKNATVFKIIKNQERSGREVATDRAQAPRQCWRLTGYKPHKNGDRDPRVDVVAALGLGHHDWRQLLEIPHQPVYGAQKNKITVFEKLQNAREGGGNIGDCQGTSHTSFSW